MSSPSSAKVGASSSKIARTAKRDVNASRSRAFGASSVSNSSRKVNGTTAQSGSGQSTRVFLDGVDVTPQSLLVSRIKPSTAQEQQRAANRGKGSTTRRFRNAHNSGNGSSVMGASVILSTTSTSSLDESSDTDVPSSSTSGGAKSSGTAAKGSSSAAGAGASKANASPSVPATPVLAPAPSPTASSNQNDDDDAVAPESDAPSASGEPKHATAAVTSTPTTAFGKDSGSVASTTSTTSTVPQGKPEKTRRRPITIQLAETPTMVVFELRSVCVSSDSSSHQAIAARNRQYLEMCAAKKGSDKYVEGRSQTLQLAQKGKEVMTAPPATRDVMCVATDWDIFDCARIEEDNQNEHDESGAMDTVAVAGNATPGAASSKSSRALSEYENGDLQLKHQVDEIVEATLVSPGCVLDVDGDIVEDLKVRQHARTRRAKNAHGTNSQRSRTYHANSSTQSQQDLGRSSANAMPGNSSSSMASTSQSGANLSFGASQDAVGGAGSAEDSGNVSVQNSPAGGTSSASRGVLSAESSGDDTKQSAYARANVNVDIGATIAQQRTAKVLASQSLLKTVRVVERAVQQNVYHQQHVLYRNFPSLVDPDITENASQQQLISESGDWRSSIGAASSSGSGAGTRTSGSAGKGGALEKLWAFHCKLTENRRVSCLAWNTVNEDLLAVSYGRVERRPPSASSLANGEPGAGGLDSTGGEDDGLILFWSLKNPEYPERVYNLGAGVMSIDFSQSQPYLLAVGFANGVVAIFDTRKDESMNTSDGAGARSSSAHGSTPAPVNSSGVRQAPGLPGARGGSSLPGIRLHTPVPIATSEVSPGKHLDVLWQVKWISKGSDRGENVVSISSDGRVTEWSMKKGLSYSDLMTLKRIANPLLGSDSRADGVISRQASGHCVDFATSDPSVYFVGTEDGLIHKCSVSYNEQYLQTYFGHTGPVYQILVSPFCSDLFLSCSGDWNVKLWHQGEQKEVLTFRSVDLAHAMHGISWCPSDSTVFGAVSEDGRIEIWDLGQSTLDPIITHFPKKYAPRAAGTGAAIRGSPNLDRGGNGSGVGLGALDDSLTPPSSAPGVTGGTPSGGGGSSGFGATLSQSELFAQPLEVSLECTKIAFAPSAPIIVVGDSTGDVTVYRVPALTDFCSGAGTLSSEELVAKLVRAINPNKHE
ncbi:hypothetical protein PybrP1_002974 [[Pythium] brassicae (nom. inval.)]|nr:hypothetical protein PybrP1_002974 [[Pythium] brassicae (nom. inval.)]